MQRPTRYIVGRKEFIMATNGNYLRTVDLKCQQCAGKCWDKDQSKRQAKARAMFGGVIPNSCVDAEIGGTRCPFHS